MASDALQHGWWPAPTLGEFSSLPPDAIPARGARELRNFLLHCDGKVVPRGNIGGVSTDVASLAHPDGYQVAGHYLTSPGMTNVVVGYRYPSNIPLVDPWRVPINTPTDPSDLAQPATGTTQDLADVDLRTGVVTPNTVPAGATDAVPGYRYAFLGGQTYTTTLGGPSTAVPTGVAHATKVLAGVLCTHGPVFVQDVISHFNRMFVAAARQPDGSDYDPSQVFNTVDGGITPGADLLSDWQDPVSGLVNVTVVGAGDDKDFVVAFGKARGQLIIFKRRSVWCLYGTSVEDMVLRQLREGAGCIDARSVVSADVGVYFASEQGYEFFDGSAFSVVSRPINDLWQEFSMSRGPGAATRNYGYIMAALLPNNYIFVSLGATPSPAHVVDAAEQSWLYYVPSGGWTRLTSTLSSTGALSRAVRAPHAVALWAGSTSYRADGVTYGPDPAVGLRDRQPVASVSTSYSVPLRWRSGVMDLGAAWEAARLSRGTVDYRQTWDPAAPVPANTEPMGTATLHDDAGTAVSTARTLTGYQPATAPLRTRPTWDCNYELPQGGVELLLESSIGSGNTRHGEFAVYGAGVEYQTGRGRRKYQPT